MIKNNSRHGFFSGSPVFNILFEFSAAFCNESEEGEDCQIAVSLSKDLYNIMK